MYRIESWVHHKCDGLVSWYCSILPSSPKQAIPTRPQVHYAVAHLTPPAMFESETDSDEVEVISYSSVCEAIEDLKQ